MAPAVSGVPAIPGSSTRCQCTVYEQREETRESIRLPQDYAFGPTSSCAWPIVSCILTAVYF